MRAIGDKVWTVKVERQPVEEQCPDCLGTAKWQCILPNGEAFAVECARCYPGGYDCSTGVIHENYEYAVVAKASEIAGIDTRAGKLEYATADGYCCLTETAVFDTEEEAVAFGRATIVAQYAANDAAMQATARSKGRPKKNSANPSEFGGGSAAYARRQVRAALHEALRWSAYADRRGTQIDVFKMLEAAMNTKH